MAVWQSFWLNFWDQGIWVWNYGDDSTVDNTGEGIVDNVCETNEIPNERLENFYSYKLIPFGQTGITLNQEKNKKLDLQAQVTTANSDLSDHPLDIAVLTRGNQLVEKVLNSCNITWNDIFAQGGTIGAGTLSDKLGTLDTFLLDQIKILALLENIVAGHLAYHRREYQLALDHYNKTEQWFKNSDNYEELHFYFENKDEGGNLVPHFIEPPIDTIDHDDWVSLGLSTWDDYYLGKFSATTLDSLQITWNNYHKMSLSGLGLPTDSNVNVFSHFLYYIHNFVLPLSKSDVYLKLGNYCQSLTECLKCHYDSTYFELLSNTDELILAERIKPSTYPPASQLGLDSTGYGNYHTNYLNPIERKVIDLKVAQIFQLWGEFYERKAKPWNNGDQNTINAKNRYSQVLRIFFNDWSLIHDHPADDFESYQDYINSNNLNPFLVNYVMLANVGLARLDNKLNFLGYSPNLIPIWTYEFLLFTTRYYIGRTELYERDALNFLRNAEQELGNQRLLSQQISNSQSLLGVASRKIVEANSTIATAQQAVDLADLRIWNNKHRQDDLEFYGPAQVALGTVGGAIGGASSGGGLYSGASGGGTGAGFAGAAVIGAAVGGFTSYLSGNIELNMQRHELQRQGLELDAQKLLSISELDTARISASITQMYQNIAAANLAFANSNFEFASNKNLNADFWFESAKRFQDLSKNYLDQAIRLAYLTEQAYEFEEGRKINRIRFDYWSGENSFAASSLLSDLDSIESERILSRNIKRKPIKQVISLRKRDFQAFSDFKRSGKITFDTTISEFDFAYPGTFRRKIIDVEVEISALVGSEEIRGELTKKNIFFERFYDGSNTYANVTNIIQDWIQNTPTQYKIATALQNEETLILSTFDLRKDSIVLRAKERNEQLGIFEGSGVASTWELQISPCSNEFNMDTIMDVKIILYYTAQYDSQLHDAIELEKRKLIALNEFINVKTKGYSFRESLPDQFYHILNRSPDIDSLQKRLVFFSVTSHEFPQNEFKRLVEGIVITFVTENGTINVNPKISSNVRSPLYDSSKNYNDIVWFPTVMDNFLIEPSLSNHVKATESFVQNPEDQWILEINAENNPDLSVTDNMNTVKKYRVDITGKLVLDAAGDLIEDPAGKPILDDNKLAKIQDIWWIFRYNSDLKNECGHPIIFWDHFTKSNISPFNQIPPSRIKQDHTLENTLWTKQNLDLNGSDWVFNEEFNEIEKTGRGMSQYQVDLDYTPANYEINFKMTIPIDSGVESGIVFAHNTIAGINTFFKLKLVNSAEDSQVDLVLEKSMADVITILTGNSENDTGLTRGNSYKFNILIIGRKITIGIDDKIFTQIDQAGNKQGHFRLWSKGAGAKFQEIWFSDLDNRI